ncbi:MAG: hypothetical protein QOJ63_3310 [Solirubrobacteraceae bacterium]|nr:hypothetical protein [Solirubrobacteraceae bacterium]
MRRPRVARRRDRQQARDVGAFERIEEGGDLGTDGDEILDEALEVFHEPILVGAEGLDVGVVEVDRSLEGAHERLCVVRQVGEATHQIAQEQAHAHRVRIGLTGELVQRAQLRRDVGQGDSLQRPAASQVLVVGGQRALDRLTFTGELIEEPRAVEILDGGHAARVRIVAQVAPLHERAQRVGDRIRVDAWLRPGERLADVLRSQMHHEPLLRAGERAHDLAIQRNVGRREMREGIESSTRHGDAR